MTKYIIIDQETFVKKTKKHKQKSVCYYFKQGCSSFVELIIDSFSMAPYVVPYGSMPVNYLPY